MREEVIKLLVSLGQTQVTIVKVFKNRVLTACFSWWCYNYFLKVSKGFCSVGCFFEYVFCEAQESDMLARCPHGRKVPQCIRRTKLGASSPGPLPELGEL